jgi:16S rRNA processing protein RimM
MNYIYIGDIVNTHGIKGEVRILSHFKFKSCVFVNGNFLYVGNFKKKLEIKSYRKHKIFDMVSFVGIDDINDVLEYKGEAVYIDRNEIKIDGILNEDLIDMDVYGNGNFLGSVADILNNGVYDILVIENNEKRSLVPNIPEFIVNVDINARKIDINMMEGLINEN